MEIIATKMKTPSQIQNKKPHTLPVHCTVLYNTYQLSRLYLEVFTSTSNTQCAQTKINNNFKSICLYFPKAKRLIRSMANRDYKRQSAKKTVSGGYTRVAFSSGFLSAELASKKLSQSRLKLFEIYCSAHHQLLSLRREPCKIW